MANEIPGNVDLDRIIGDTDITGTMTFVSGSTLTMDAGATISGDFALLGITTTAGLDVDGGIINLNASSNFAVNVATGTSTGTVSIGSGTGAQAVAIASGTGDVTITSTDDIVIQGTTGSVVGIATNAFAQTVNIGTGGAAQAVTVGSTTTTSATTIQSGSGHVNVAAGANNLNITAATTAITGAATVSTTLGVTGKTTLTGGVVLPATMAGTATLTNGTVTVATAGVDTLSKIFLSIGTPTNLTVNVSAPAASIIDATSFVINGNLADSTVNAADDTTTVNWFIVNPN
jgi:hypothetical protein